MMKPSSKKSTRTLLFFIRIFTMISSASLEELLINDGNDTMEEISSTSIMNHDDTTPTMSWEPLRDFEANNSTLTLEENVTATLASLTDHTETVVATTDLSNTTDPDYTEMMTESSTSEELLYTETEEPDEQRTRHSRYRDHFRKPTSSGPSYRYPKPEFKQPPYHVANIPSFGSAVRTNLTKVNHLTADCYSNYMKVSLNFNGSFNGLIYSTGYALDAECVYVNGSGASSYQFFIRLNRCGTLGHKQGNQKPAYRGYTVPPIVKYGIPGETVTQSENQFMFNSLTIQYNKLIEEEEDEQIRVSCEYGNDYWKTVNFPVVNVEINTGQPAMAFTLTPPQCTMEIKEGYGTAGNRISGPVTVGDSLTLMIHMKSVVAGFDIVVSNCVAHNGGQKKLQLIDANGCVLSEKLVSRFRGFNSVDTEEERVTLYAFLKAFRFTGSPALYLECDVRMCHGTCPPQRCYWRSLTKRSAEDTEEPASSLSESVSLTQALDVRHDRKTDQEALQSLRDEGSVCLRVTTFSTLMSISMSAIVLLSCATLWLCKSLKRSSDSITNPSRSYSSRSIIKLS